MSESNKTIVTEINEAFSNNRVEDFLKYCADDIVWRFVGEKTTKGISAIREWLVPMQGSEPPRFTVDELIAEGDSVVCRGDMTMKDENGVEKLYAYCDSYQFRNGKVFNLDSYVIHVKTEQEDEKTAAA